jgi:hydrophobe/amphiphile efflux-3 (HAE3) family protein
MIISNDVIIYSVVFVLSFVTFFGFLRIGVKKIASTATAKPILFFVLSLVIVGILGIGMKNLVLEPDVKVLLPEKLPARSVFDKIERLFGGVDTVYFCITTHKGTIWDAHVLSQVHEISKNLKTSPYIDNVLSITETKSISNEDDMMKVSDVVPEGLDFSSPEAVDIIHRNAKANDILYKRLVSGDGRSTLIVANVNLHKEITSPDGKKEYVWIQDKDLCEPIPGDPEKPTLLNLVEKYKDPAYKLTVTGFPYLRYHIWLQMASDMKVFLILGIIVMLAFLYASFRTLRGMLLPLTVVLLGLAASFGFMGWMKEKITLPFLIMGPMLIAIAHNYGTQLIAKYYEDVQDECGPFTRDDIRRISQNCIISLGAPVLISAVTVIVGFVTMITHPIRGLALLGFFCAFGIIVSFILTIILTPSILSLLNIPRMLIEKSHGTRTDQALKAVAEFTIRRKSGMLMSVLVLAAVCLYFIPKIEADANVMNHFSKSSDISKDAEFISNTFGGYSTLNILIEATRPAGKDSPEDGPMKNPEILQWMDGLQKFALKQTDPKTNTRLIGDALSMADFVSYMNKVMKNDPKEETVPGSRNLIAQYLLSYENQSSDEFSSLVDYKYNKAQIIVRLPDMSTPRLHVLIANLKQYIQDHPMKEIQVSFGGAVEINAELGTLIVEGQIWSLMLSVLIIVICYMIFFRAFAAGMLAAVPLFCAIVIVFGIMGVMKIPLDYITATLTGISIGVGTDYTAYFLWRLRERSLAAASLEKGYVETMTSIGKGILYNGLSVVVGFFVFFFSNFIPIRFFGFLVSFSILACILSTLTILPIVIFIVKPKFLLQGASNTGASLEMPLQWSGQKTQTEAPGMVLFKDSVQPEDLLER